MPEEASYSKSKGVLEVADIDHGGGSSSQSNSLLRETVSFLCSEVCSEVVTFTLGVSSNMKSTFMYLTMANGFLHSIGIASLQMQFQGISLYLPLGLLLYTRVSGMITPLIYLSHANRNTNI